MNWTEYYKLIAENVRLKSKDKNTKIGAVIVGEGGQIISTGYNSFPRGINDTLEERQERPEKYYWFAHAEVNAIVNAARSGVSTLNSTIYLTCGIPCTTCAMAIINAGIKRVVCNSYKNGITGGKGAQWDEHGKRSLIMLAEAGVQLDYYENSDDVVQLVDKNTIINTPNDQELGALVRKKLYENK